MPCTYLAAVWPSCYTNLYLNRAILLWDEETVEHIWNRHRLLVGDVEETYIMSASKNKRLKATQTFQSRAEEREFWDTHDSTEYFDDSKMVRLAPLMKGRKLVHVFVAPDGIRWEMRKLSPQHLAYAHNPPQSKSRRTKTRRAKKMRVIKVPFLIN